MRLALCAAWAAVMAFGQPCTRGQLSSFADAYFQAIEKRDPRLLATTKAIQVIENGRETKYGAGFFLTGGKLLGSQRLIDTSRCGVLTWGVIDETIDGATAPIMVAVRLAIADAKVAEIEAILHRKEERYFNPQAMLAALQQQPPSCIEGGVRVPCPAAIDLDPTLSDAETGVSAAFREAAVQVFPLRADDFRWVLTLFGTHSTNSALQ